MRRRSVCLFLAIGLFSVQCALFRERIPPYPSGLIFPIEETFSVAYGGEIDGLILRSDGLLYFSTRNGLVFCLDGLKKRILWKFKAEADFLTSPCLGAHGLTIYDRSNTLYHLDLQGQLIWQKKIEASIASELRENEGIIYFGLESGELIALDSNRGEEIWRFKAGGAVRAAPAFSGQHVIFGCDDGKVYFLTEKGKFAGNFSAGSGIRVAPVVDDDRLYFGSADNHFYCLGLARRSRKWRILMGGRISTEPIVDKKRLYFFTSNNVLYCLNKRSGDILWWQPLPSHSVFRLELVADKIVASSLSTQLACYDIETGKKAGDYNAPLDLKSNVLWLNPYLLVNIYNPEREEGELIYLSKQVKVFLGPYKTSPQKAGDEIGFMATAYGFFLPKFEFYLKEAEKSEVVQEESDKNTFIWYPQKEGTYVVGVRVSDGKEKAEAEVPYTIEKKGATEKKEIKADQDKKSYRKENQPCTETKLSTF